MLFEINTKITVIVLFAVVSIELSDFFNQWVNTAIPRDSGLFDFVDNNNIINPLCNFFISSHAHCGLGSNPVKLAKVW